MFKNKLKQSKIFNKNLPLINVLCLLATLYLGYVVNNWYFIFLILVILISLKIKPNKIQILFCIGIISIFLILMIFAKEFSLFNLFSWWFKSDIVRNSIFNYYDSIYKPEIASFIKLVLFGVKSKETYVFYKQTVDLGIVWLISVGGFHVSFLSRILKKSLKKIWKVGKWVDVFIILSYSYLLKFSYSSMRVLFSLLFAPIFERFNIKTYNKIGAIGLIFCLLNPSCFKSYSFLLSFIGVTSACFVNSLNIEHKIINLLLIGTFGFLSTIPFAINFNHKISLFTFVNSFVFGYIFSFVFLYFLIFSWIPIMAIIHWGIIVFCYATIGNISYLNIYIRSDTWEPYFVFVFYLCENAICKLLYLIVLNNKI